MENIMIDLETLGTKPNAVILSIGAVYFDIHGLGEQFYVNIEPRTCLAAGLTVDEATKAWWEKQDQAAKDALTVDRRPLQVALEMFRNFVKNKRDTKIWGNGASFDNVILREAYKATGITPPWAWWNDRCFRTMHKESVGVERIDNNELKHNALADAVDQAEHMVRIFKAGGKLYGKN